MGQLIPIYIDEQGRFYSPNDPLPTGERAAEWVKRTMMHHPLLDHFLSLTNEEEEQRDV